MIQAASINTLSVFQILATDNDAVELERKVLGDLLQIIIQYRVQDLIFVKLIFGAGGDGKSDGAVDLDHRIVCGIVVS